MSGENKCWKKIIGILTTYSPQEFDINEWCVIKRDYVKTTGYVKIPGYDNINEDYVKPNKCLCGVNIIDHVYVENNNTDKKEFAVIGNVCIKNFKDEEMMAQYKLRKKQRLTIVRNKKKAEINRRKELLKKLKAIGAKTLPFKKYKGQSINRVFVRDKGYLLWLSNNMTGITIDDIKLYLKHRR